MLTDSISSDFRDKFAQYIEQGKQAMQEHQAKLKRGEVSNFLSYYEQEAIDAGRVWIDEKCYAIYDYEKELKYSRKKYAIQTEVLDPLDALIANTPE